MFYPRAALLSAIALLASTILAAGATEEVPFRMVNGLVVVEIPTGTGTLSFVVDSGSEASLIDIRVAHALRLRWGKSENIAGVTARTRGYWTKDFEGAIGETPLPRHMLAVDISAIAGRFDCRIDGLIGADFIRRHPVRIDYPRRRLALLDPGAATAHGIEIPMSVRGGVFCVKASVNDGKAGWARVDTGCVDGLHWSGDSARGKGSREKSVAVSHSAYSRYTSSDVKIGGLSIADVRTVLRPAPLFAGESGLLGSRVLSRYVVTIDAPGRRLVLE